MKTFIRSVSRKIFIKQPIFPSPTYLPTFEPNFTADPKELLINLKKQQIKEIMDKMTSRKDENVDFRYRTEYFSRKMNPLKLNVGSIINVHYRNSMTDAIHKITGALISYTVAYCDATFTIRCTKAGVTFDMVFNVFSPLVCKIEVLKRTFDRRSKWFPVEMETDPKTRRKLKYKMRFARPKVGKISKAEDPEERIKNWTSAMIYPPDYVPPKNELPWFVLKAKELLKENNKEIRLMKSKEIMKAEELKKPAKPKKQPRKFPSKRKKFNNIMLSRKSKRGK